MDRSSSARRDGGSPLLHPPPLRPPCHQLSERLLSSGQDVMLRFSPLSDEQFSRSSHFSAGSTGSSGSAGSTGSSGFTGFLLHVCAGSSVLPSLQTPPCDQWNYFLSGMGSQLREAPCGSSSSSLLIFITDECRRQTNLCC